MHQGGGENNGSNNNNYQQNNNTYSKTNYTNAKLWMERRLSKFKSGIPKDDAANLAREWADATDAGDIDHRIIEIEAAQIAKQYNRFHVPRLGNMSEERPEGVLRLLFGQLNSASTDDVRDRKVDQINQVVDKWDVQGGGLLEVGVNWSSWPSSYSFASWFLSERETRSSVAWNKNAGENIGRRQQGGVALFACKELLGYRREANHDFRNLGRWNSWRIYSNPNHVTRIISAYFTGKQRPRSEGSIYQQQLRYIQENGLDTTPRNLFLVDFIAQLRTWRSQGERLLIHLDMNEPILQGELGQRLLSSNLDLKEATHKYWGANEPNTFIDGRRAIDGLFYTDDLEINALSILSFHEGIGDHRTFLVDISTLSAFGEFKYKVVRPAARRLNTQNEKSLNAYIKKAEAQVDIHRLDERIQAVEKTITTYPPTDEQRGAMERIDKQAVEVQQGSENSCRRITKCYLSFCEPVRYWVLRKRAYQGLERIHLGKTKSRANLLRKAEKMEIPDPASLSLEEVRAGIEYCRRRMHNLKCHEKERRRDHLRNRLVLATDMGDKKKAKAIRNIITREDKKSMFRRINRVTDDPKVGAITKVQKEVDGKIVDITEQAAMTKEIQEVTEKRFELAHSAPITNTSLAEKLGYTSDTDFAEQLFAGTATIPDDVPEVTALVVEEIIRLGMEVRHSGGEVLEITPEEFRRYWKQVKEGTSSSISTVHFGHYKAAAQSDKLTALLSRKITVVARAGLPPSRWGNGLQVMLEKIAGVALVNKLRSILLMEADYNFFNKWAFGYEAMNKLYEMGYVPEEHYSQRQSTAEDARMDTRLTSDISRQLRHPYVTTSCDATNCYDAINHIVLAFLLLAITCWRGAVVALLSPIQIMRFFQRTAFGDSTTFMGGPGRDTFLQGICQGNGAGPACWLMLSSALIHCYRKRGRGAKIISPISRTIISFIGSMFVDDTDLVSWLPNLTDAQQCFEDMQDSCSLWGSLLIASGGRFKPEKCYWSLIDYECTDGKWDYASTEPLEMLVPMPDGSFETITQVDVHEPKEMLGVWGCPAGDDTKHLEEKVVGRVAKWITRTKNGHLPSKFAWVSYRFKLWAGVRYGLATLATPLSVAQELLRDSEFKMLSFLGVNKNIKREWRTLPRSFGGVGLFSFPIEQMICWLNMIIQHFGVPSILGNKFLASLEALQLELGCLGNPLLEPYHKLHHLATACWFKVFWERLAFYKWMLYMDYPEMPLQRAGDASLLSIFLQANVTESSHASLNRCRLALELIFLSDMVTADGRNIDPTLLVPPADDTSHSRFTFPQERPTAADWKEWFNFWTAYTGTSFSLNIPLGRWTAPTHRTIKWFYSAAEDQVEEVDDEIVHLYRPADVRQLTRANLRYKYVRSISAKPTGNPVSVSILSDTDIIRHSVGPSLAIPQVPSQDFWSYLLSLGGEWMWEHIVESEKAEIEWLPEALRTGTAILVTDGSFDRKRAPDTSGAGWIIICTKTKRRVRGSFYEVSNVASAYRGELLGLVAIHTIVWAAAQYYRLPSVQGKICCDNQGALYKSSYSPRRIRTGAPHADLLRALRSLKINKLFQMTYDHVDSHQDRYKLWFQLSLPEQLNVICDGLAKEAVERRQMPLTPIRTGPQLLPLEKIAVFVDGVKLTSDVSKDIRFSLGKVEARKFYTAPKVIVKDVNKGGLGWSTSRFDQVDWKALDTVLSTKPENYGLWLSKQVAGVSATRANMSRIWNLGDDKCPCCCAYRETRNHLNVCPDYGRTRLFQESTVVINDWMLEDNRTDSELAYLLSQYIAYRGSRTFSSLGPMSTAMEEVAASQDAIGWVEFMHGRISKEIRTIQQAHCAMSSCRMNGNDWVHKFVAHLLHLSHSQWIYRNFILHDQVNGYLKLKKRHDVLLEIERLIETDPDDIPQESQFLLDMDFDNLLTAGTDRQSYWVRAMQAARKAGRRTAALAGKVSASVRRRAAKQRALRPVIDNELLQRHLREELGIGGKSSRRRPHPSSDDLAEPNKRWRPPE